MQVINAIRSAIRFSTSQRETPKECFSILSRSAPPPLSLSLSFSPFPILVRNFHEFSRNLMSASHSLLYKGNLWKQ